MKSRLECMKKRIEISHRLRYLQELVDNEKISLSRFMKHKQKLIEELHTLDYALGTNGINKVDSDEWFKKFE